MASVVYALPYPCLADGNFSFPDGTYEAIPKTSQGSDPSVESVAIEHQIRNAPLLETLIREGKAQFGCLVAVPKTSYRRLEMAAPDSTQQTVHWNKDIVGEPPMLQPLLLGTEETEHQLYASDGVAKPWQRQTITIPKGARLARHIYFRRINSIYDMLSLVPAPDFEPGSFEVRSCVEDGFHFKMFVATDVHHFLKNPRQHQELHRSICVHAVSRCFEILAQDYGSGEGETDKWAMHVNLRMLADELREKGLSCWMDVGFKPDAVATNYYPLKLPNPK